MSSFNFFSLKLCYHVIVVTRQSLVYFIMTACYIILSSRYNEMVIDP